MTTRDAIQMYGADWCGDFRRTQQQLIELEIDFDYIDVDADAAAAAQAEKISGRKNIPVLVYPDGAHQVEPSNAEVEAKLRELSFI